MRSKPLNEPRDNLGAFKSGTLAVVFPMGIGGQFRLINSSAQ
jgi:hypothetical protein